MGNLHVYHEKIHVVQKQYSCLCQEYNGHATGDVGDGRIECNVEHMPGSSIGWAGDGGNNADGIVSSCVLIVPLLEAV
jgi:hypothetical protein